VRKAKAKAGKARSTAALCAFLLCAWAQSLLLFEFLRTSVFEPRGLSHLLLVLPLFALSVVAAIVAALGRARGVEQVGGPLVRGLGIASGLLACTAILLASVFSPRLGMAADRANRLEALRRVEEVAVAVEKHARSLGAFPAATTRAQLAEQLVPTWLSNADTLGDPWGHDLEYRSLSDGRGYLVLSSGRDGELDLPLASYVDDPSRVLSGNDIAIMNGHLLASGSSSRDDAARVRASERERASEATTRP
jgi:hypothetical protein